MLRIATTGLRLIAAIVTAIFHVRPRCSEHLAAVLAGAFPAAALRRLLPVEFGAAVRTAEQCVCPLGGKFLPAALAGQHEGLSDSVFTGLDFLIPLPALDAVPLELLLPLDFFFAQLRDRQLKPPDEP